MDLKDTAPSRCVLRVHSSQAWDRGRMPGSGVRRGMGKWVRRVKGKEEVGGGDEPRSPGRGRGLSGRGRVERRKRKGGASRRPNPQHSLQERGN